MRLKSALLTFAILFLFYSSNVLAQGYKIKTIVIDAGHGGVKPGAAGKYSLEKNVALKVALKLGKKLEEELPGIKIIQIRKTDVDVDWYRRAEIANDAKADLFISIHCNSMGGSDRTTRGTETFVGAYRRINEMDAGLKENEDILKDKDYKKKGTYDPTNPEELIMLSLYKSLYRAKSLALAKMIQKNYTNVNKRVNRGVKEQGLLILQRAAMPSVLTEIGFISNPAEEDYINSPEGQEEIVTAIVNAIKQYKKEIEI
ncbi:N-acetylmuramoyl-L-alanine amidase family protein [Pedobacter boryungensis]|uniref:N-acetylmuramoyl-L-alanine amidase n=1 Tax=Pedobacter boryungensis TaxID=869962 RepID=A0ABX2DC81_9SPHI|nr:N-acetylmuramoyl-L-alanine amidase [Pedobacter boryungensis]NQX30936.1 N-acetylmuramoyl-L-alanine amidase [Pedobacter boryungensis]